MRKLVDLDEPAPALGRRVQGRRPASRLRVPALARLPRARRVGLGPRSRAVVRHEASLLAPLACVLVWEAGVARLRLGAGSGSPCSRRRSRSSASGRGTAARSSRSRCRRRSSRQLLVPAAIALFFARTRRWRGYAAVAAIFGALDAGASDLRRLPARAARSPSPFWHAGARGSSRRSSRSGSSCSGCGRSSTRRYSHNPSASDAGARTSRSTARSSSSRATDHFRLAAEVFGRTGAVAVAALVPAAGDRARAPAPLGRVRARRHVVVLLADARALALRALLGRRLALAVAPRRPGSSRSRSPSPAVAALVARRRLAAPARARRRDRPAAPVARRLRLRPAARRARRRDLVRARRRRRALARSSFLALRRPPLREHHGLGARAAASSCCRWSCTGSAHWSPDPKTDPRRSRPARPQPAHEGPQGRGRPRPARHELPRRRQRAGLRRRGAGRRTWRTRRRTTRTAARARSSTGC